MHDTHPLVMSQSVHLALQSVQFSPYWFASQPVIYMSTLYVMCEKSTIIPNSCFLRGYNFAWINLLWDLTNIKTNKFKYFFVDFDDKHVVLETDTNVHLLIRNTKLMLINKNNTLQWIRIVCSSYYFSFFRWVIFFSGRGVSLFCFMKHVIH